MAKIVVKMIFFFLFLYFGPSIVRVQSFVPNNNNNNNNPNIIIAPWQQRRLQTFLQTTKLQSSDVSSSSSSSPSSSSSSSSQHSHYNTNDNTNTNTNTNKKINNDDDVNEPMDHEALLSLVQFETRCGHFDRAEETWRHYLEQQHLQKSLSTTSSTTTTTVTPITMIYLQFAQWAEYEANNVPLAQSIYSTMAQSLSDDEIQQPIVCQEYSAFQKRQSHLFPVQQQQQQRQQHEYNNNNAIQMEQIFKKNSLRQYDPRYQYQTSSSSSPSSIMSTGTTTTTNGGNLHNHNNNNIYNNNMNNNNNNNGNEMYQGNHFANTDEMNNRPRGVTRFRLERRRMRDNNNNNNNNQKKKELPFTKKRKYNIGPPFGPPKRWFPEEQQQQQEEENNYNDDEMMDFYFDGDDDNDDDDDDKNYRKDGRYGIEPMGPVFGNNAYRGPQKFQPPSQYNREEEDDDDYDDNYNNYNNNNNFRRNKRPYRQQQQQQQQGSSSYYGPSPMGTIHPMIPGLSACNPLPPGLNRPPPSFPTPDMMMSGESSFYDGRDNIMMMNENSMMNHPSLQSTTTTTTTTPFGGGGHTSNMLYGMNSNGYISGAPSSTPVTVPGGGIGSSPPAPPGTALSGIGTRDMSSTSNQNNQINNNNNNYHHHHHQQQQQQHHNEINNIGTNHGMSGVPEFASSTFYNNNNNNNMDSVGQTITGNSLQQQQQFVHPSIEMRGTTGAIGSIDMIRETLQGRHGMMTISGNMNGGGGAGGNGMMMMNRGGSLDGMTSSSSSFPVGQQQQQNHWFQEQIQEFGSQSMYKAQYKPFDGGNFAFSEPFVGRPAPAEPMSETPPPKWASKPLEIKSNSQSKTSTTINNNNENENLMTNQQQQQSEISNPNSLEKDDNKNDISNNGS